MLGVDFRQVGVLVELPLIRDGADSSDPDVRLQNRGPSVTETLRARGIIDAALGR
jgi:hypothetical protein